MMSLTLGDNYSLLREDVRNFIVSFHEHIKSQNIVEIENDCQIRFPKLTEQYFMTSRWPSAEVISQLVDNDPLFIMLYNELYYRHIYAHNSTGLSLEDMIQSFSNYCSLFNQIIKATKPIKLSLPNQWLWDIIDEFIYQFQKFCAFRNRQKHKAEDEALLNQNFRVWSIHCVLNVLYSLVEKSSINEQLSYYAKLGDPDEIADEFGRCALYKMLGFFSLIGLCRLHCLLGDYCTAIKLLENIKINRLEMYHEVPTCHITTGYYVGFAYLMMKRYQEAYHTLTSTLSYKSRASVLIGQRPDLHEYVNKQADQMSCLAAICLTMGWITNDHNLDADRRDKFPETLNRLQQLDELEFCNSFDLGCPKFISPRFTRGDLRDPVPEPQRQQTELFRIEIRQQIELLRLRSFLKLYTNIPISKLASYMKCSELDLHSSLMAYKYRLKQKQSDLNQIELMTNNNNNADDNRNQADHQQQAGMNNGSGGMLTDLSNSTNPQSLLTDLNLYIDKSTIYIADTTMDRRFSEYFIRNIEMLLQLNSSVRI